MTINELIIQLQQMQRNGRGFSEVLLKVSNPLDPSGSDYATISAVHDMTDSAVFTVVEHVVLVEE